MQGYRDPSESLLMSPDARYFIRLSRSMVSAMSCGGDTEKVIGRPVIG